MSGVPSQIIELGCWLNSLFNKENIRFAVLVLWMGNPHTSLMDTLHRGPITLKTLPSDEVMLREPTCLILCQSVKLWTFLVTLKWFQFYIKHHPISFCQNVQRFNVESAHIYQIFVDCVIVAHTIVIQMFSIVSCFVSVVGLLLFVCPHKQNISKMTKSVISIATFRNCTLNFPVVNTLTNFVLQSLRAWFLVICDS